jgi:hypothetical protein
VNAILISPALLFVSSGTSRRWKDCIVKEHIAVSTSLLSLSEAGC